MRNGGIFGVDYERVLGSNARISPGRSAAQYVRYLCGEVVLMAGEIDFGRFLVAVTELSHPLAISTVEDTLDGIQT